MKKVKVRSQKRARHDARQRRVRKSIHRTDRTWLTVYRSARHIYAQLVDPQTGKTLTTISSRSKDVAGDLSSTGNVEAAKRVGTAIANAAKAREIDRVVFNRNGFLYHGRVKALAEAAREAGLQF